MMPVLPPLVVWCGPGLGLLGVVAPFPRGVLVVGHSCEFGSAWGVWEEMHVTADGFGAAIWKRCTQSHTRIRCVWNRGEGCGEG